MNKRPLDNLCLERCPIQKFHFYNETLDSCIYDDSAERKKYYRYCSDSIEIDGLEGPNGLFSNLSINCTMVNSVAIRNIPFNNTVDIIGRLFKVFEKIGDIRHCLTIEDSPGISTLHFMLNLGEIRGKCSNTSYSTVIRNNENLHHFFMQGFKSKRGAIFVQNNSALCQDEIDMFMKQSEIKSGSSLQTSDCTIPVINFNVLHALDSALIQVDKLKDGVDYNLTYMEKNNEDTKIEVSLLTDSVELSLTPNTHYQAVISYKAKSDEHFRFNSSLIRFSTRAFESFLNITDIAVTNNSSFIQWSNLNNIQSAFYLVVIKRAQPATQIKNGWDRK